MDTVTADRQARDMDPWEILGLPQTASIEEIKQAYRARARQCHPDASGSRRTDARAFRRLRGAYETLIKDCVAPPQTVYVPTSGMEAGACPPDLSDGTFVFVQVSPQDALQGAAIEIVLEDREDFCPRCTSSGRVPGRNERRCDACSGSGHHIVPWGDERLRVLCTACSGTGFVKRPLCSFCQGRGRISRKRKVRVHLPRGVRSGSLLKVPGQGLWRPERQGRDQLYVEIGVELPAGWRLLGQDIHATLGIDIWTALTGGHITVPTLEGFTLCHIPPGLPSGSAVCLAGKGWTDETGTRGDHVVTFHIDLPRHRPGALAQSLIRWLKVLWPVRKDGPLSLPFPCGAGPGPSGCCH